MLLFLISAVAIISIVLLLVKSYQLKHTTEKMNGLLDSMHRDDKALPDDHNEAIEEWEQKLLGYTKEVFHLTDFVPNPRRKYNVLQSRNTFLHHMSRFLFEQSYAGSLDWTVQFKPERLKERRVFGGTLHRLRCEFHHNEYKFIVLLTWASTPDDDGVLREAYTLEADCLGRKDMTVEGEIDFDFGGKLSELALANAMDGYVPKEAVEIAESLKEFA